MTTEKPKKDEEIEEFNLQDFLDKFNEPNIKENFSNCGTDVNRCGSENKKCGSDDKKCGNNEKREGYKQNIDNKTLEKAIKEDSNVYNSMQNIEWYLEEAQIILDNYKNTLYNSTVNNASRLLPYFQEALNDENPDIRKMAQEGIIAAQNVLESRDLRTL